MLRIIAYAHDGVQRFPLAIGSSLVGSLPDCEIYLPYTGVAKQHARITRDSEKVQIVDLGSRRGLLVNGRKVREAEIESLDEIRLGSITLLLEDAGNENREPSAEPSAVIDDAVIDPLRMTEHLAAVTDWVIADTESRTTLEAVVRKTLRDFGGGGLFLLNRDFDDPSSKFLVSTDPRWLAEAEELWHQVEADNEVTGCQQGFFRGRLGGEPASIFHRALVGLDRRYVLIAAFPGFDHRDGYMPEAGLSALADLLILGLVHHVGRYEPILPGAGGQQDLTLAPGLILGESKAMEKVVTRLRSIADPNAHVLLHGEPGTGRELLARTLHLSGPQRHGPFLIAACGGARPASVDADLFGAEIPGKEGPVRREGKLSLADGGTLFLQDVDRLTLDQQARLMRVLRTGEIESPGNELPRGVTLRFIATSQIPLEELVARDQFRVDLAYRLSQFAIDVPSLRDRREDLPLLIQWYINRFCHESGKRVQGITVKAMSAMMRYDFPGNLTELENLVRQMVFLAPNGQPMDNNLLPDAVRQSNLRSVTRVGPDSELRLDNLVAVTEENAIREALRRSQGNKTRAAKLLGLSRNGLALKIDRYEIE